MSKSRQALDRVGEAPTSAIGNAAGATVDPKTAAMQLKSAIAKPSVVFAVVLLAVGYLLGRRARS